MAILDPISPFLALIDRLIQLLTARKTRRREYFQTIIDPIYTQFIPLGEDYIKLFRMAAEAVQRANKKSRKAKIAKITEKREEFAAARVRLRALLEACEKGSKKKKDEELIAFLRAMLGFFTPMVLTYPGSLGRELVDFLLVWTHGQRVAREASRSPWTYERRLLEATSSNQAVPPEIELYIGQATHRLESSWYEITGRYMDLKLKCLGG